MHESLRHCTLSLHDSPPRSPAHTPPPHTWRLHWSGYVHGEPSGRGGPQTGADWGPVDGRHRRLAQSSFDLHDAPSARSARSTQTLVLGSLRLVSQALLSHSALATQRAPVSISGRYTVIAW